jgi:hypothetical protein
VLIFKLGKGGIYSALNCERDIAGFMSVLNFKLYIDGTL